MRFRTVALAVAVFSLATTLAIAQKQAQTPKAKQQQGAKKYDPTTPDKALMQTIWDGWSTRDPENVATFYSKKPNRVFYDITPLKYDGWNAYREGVKPVLKQYKSLKCVVNDDGTTHQAGPSTVWGTATVHCDGTKQDGSPDKIDFRWTVVWEKEGSQWLIAHEHVSAPLK